MRKVIYFIIAVILITAYGIAEQHQSIDAARAEWKTEWLISNGLTDMEPPGTCIYCDYIKPLISTGFFPEEAFIIPNDRFPHITFSERPKGDLGSYTPKTNTIDIDLVQSRGKEVPFHEGLHWQKVGEENLAMSHRAWHSVMQDTISSFLGKPIVINDKIYEHISAIAAHDKMLSYSDSIIQIGDVRWRVNLMPDNIVFITSVQPDDPKMKQVVKYLTGIYGKPYEDEDGYDIKWSSSDNPSDIFRPGSTLVHLRCVRSEEGGTSLIFK